MKQSISRLLYIQLHPSPDNNHPKSHPKWSFNGMSNTAAAILHQRKEFMIYRGLEERGISRSKKLEMEKQRDRKTEI